MKKILVICTLVLVLVIICAIGIGYVLGRAINVTTSTSSGSTFNYSDSSSYSVGDTEIAKRVSEININWFNGEINVESYDGDRLIVKDEVISGNLNEDLKLRWKIDGDEIKIQFSKSGKKLDLNDFKKRLVVKVPSSWRLEEIEIDVVTADSLIRIDDVKEVKWNSVNGTLDVDTSTLSSFSANSVNGDVTLKVRKNCPMELEVESVNSTLDISVPKDSSFTLERNSINGSFDSEFSGKISGKTFIVGDGNARWSIETVNGNTTINSI